VEELKLLDIVIVIFSQFGLFIKIKVKLKTIIFEQIEVRQRV